MRELQHNDTLAAALLAAVRVEMEKMVHEEAENAAERVRERARSIAPRLVMDLMANFDITRNQQDYVIRVRNVERGDPA